MDLERWKLFVKVAETGSLSKVAAMIKRRQPVVSRYISELEEDCGTTLFYRTGRGVALSETGEAILPRVHTIIREAELILCDIRARAGVPAGRVSVGLLPSLNIATDVIATAHEKFPQIDIHLTEAAVGQLGEQVVTGVIDLAVIAREPGALGGTDEGLMMLPLCVIGPPGDPLTSQAEISLAQMEGLPLIQAQPPNALRMLIEQTARRAKVRLTFGPQIDALSMQKQVVAGGLGYTIATRMSVREDIALGRLSAANITDPRMELMLALVRSSHRPPTLAIRKIARLLADAVKKRAEQYADDPTPSFRPFERSGKSGQEDMTVHADDISQVTDIHDKQLA